MRLVFDFDHTLFSTQSFYNALKKGFKDLGVEGDLFQKSYEESRNKTGRYVSSRQFNLIIRDKPKIKKEDLRKAFRDILKNSSVFLYKDTLSFLEKWQNKADLYVLSYSMDKFQRQKIISSKISKYFKKIIVTREIEKIKAFKKIFKKGEKTFFIDDDPQTLSGVKKEFKDMVSVRINRGEGKYSKLPDNKNIDFLIKNLKELEKILKGHI